MLWLYRLLFPLVLVAMAPRYVLRMRRRGGYRERFLQRFGLHPRLGQPAAKRPRIWLQAVSVGEMLAIGPLLEGLKKDDVEVYLTTTTSTGFRIAMDRYLPLVSGVGYFPLDWWPFSSLAWGRIAPDLVVLTEGERWPEHVSQAQRRGVRVVVVNARMSDRSFNRLQRFPLVARFVTRGIDRTLASSQETQRRFIDLGVPASSIQVTGNIKLDVSIPRLSAEALLALRAELGVGSGPVILGSSTWPGEEEALVAALLRCRAEGLAASLVIVPRHAERRTEIEKLLSGYALSHHFRSRGPAPGPVDICVADTTGELRKLTQVADIVFVGKSLPPHTEGQTPVEAAALGKPLVMGTGMANFRQIASELATGGAALRAASAADLAAAIGSLLRDVALRERLSEAALRWHMENSGALSRTLEVLRSELARLRQ